MRALTSLRDVPATLERLLENCLRTAGIWEASQGGDGVGLDRTLIATEDRLFVCGRLWEISTQQMHLFAFDISRVDERHFAWRLGLDPAAGSERRARGAIDHLERLEDTEWTYEASGEAESRDGTWVVVDQR